ncbi:MAG: hypothetical protein NTZ21_12685 [Actinobacteria bacterium]|nr:hypothetical protein [Actinomycetota bacterium]
MLGRRRCRAGDEFGRPGDDERVDLRRDDTTSGHHGTGHHDAGDDTSPDQLAHQFADQFIDRALGVVDQHHGVDVCVDRRA